jgi:AraC family transcriptional regulator, regulatory protein of adaptative response / methylated-DNA-[protein]-cysteine methyltransferase
MIVPGGETMTTALHVTQVDGLPDARWDAVVARDRTADARFVYAVRSTGIYCRPSCAARRPRRDRVQFYDRPALAEAAGFRACRRCRPNEPRANDAAQLVERIRRLLDERPEAVRLAQLSRAVGKSPFYLQRTFKRVMGVSPREYAAARRAARLKRELRTASSVSRAQFAAGYGSSSRLYEQAGGRLGMTPGAYRDGGAGIRIGYATVSTALGTLLVAGTERGLCVVRFGRAEAGLARELHGEFPAAELVADEPLVKRWARALSAQVDGIKPSSLVPLDVQATAFQWRVWQELRRIPFGKTKSYRQIAAALGRPRAARAVARACATNPTALAIPCHRVVREDGGLGGYRWGLERKQALLARETAARNRGAQRRVS